MEDKKPIGAGQPSGAQDAMGHRLEGTAGDDFIQGTASQDTFVFDVTNGGNDAFLGFDAISHGDRISLTGLRGYDLSEMEVSPVTLGPSGFIGAAKLDFGGGNTLTIFGVRPDMLQEHSDWFVDDDGNSLQSQMAEVFVPEEIPTEAEALPDQEPVIEPTLQSASGDGYDVEDTDDDSGVGDALDGAFGGSEESPGEEGTILDSVDQVVDQAEAIVASESAATELPTGGEPDKPTEIDDEIPKLPDDDENQSNQDSELT